MLETDLQKKIFRTIFIILGIIFIIISILMYWTILFFLPAGSLFIVIVITSIISNRKG